MKFTCTFISSVMLLLCPAAAAAETVIIPVQDLINEVPNFDNAPEFNLGAAIDSGTGFIGNPKKDAKRDTRRQERLVVQMVEEMYPDATVRLWRGNLIIRFP